MVKKEDRSQRTIAIIWLVLYASVGAVVPALIGWSALRWLERTPVVFNRTYLAMLVWLLIALTQKQSSLAALTASATAPIFVYVVTGEVWMAGTVAAMAILLFIQHRENIARLMAGTEPRIGSKKTAE